MRILHTEASNGWGGQEMRILQEAIGMRSRGHTIIFCVTTGGKLAKKAREEGFFVYELPFLKKKAFSVIRQLRCIVKENEIDLINTHSSIDAWLGGITAKTCNIKVVRTRHLSSTIRKGLNSRLLYKTFADQVMTTCEEIAKVIRTQAKIDLRRCRSVPTGVKGDKLTYKIEEKHRLREELGLQADDFVVGTCCILRSWKGLTDFVNAAAILKKFTKIKWLIIGSGPMEDLLKKQIDENGLNQCVIMAGYRENPATALSLLDVFSLLSIKNEGVSQSSLQAAYLGIPLITTNVGGLPEVCLDGKTGFLVNPNSPDQVADHVLKLFEDKELKLKFGRQASELARRSFTHDAMLDQVEYTYQKALNPM